MKRPHKKQPRPMQFETLEPRQVMAASVTLSTAGVLNVAGTSSDDHLHFRQLGSYISISGISGSWSASKVKSIVVDLGSGNDFVSFHSLANGGNKAIKEAITVISGAGNEHVQLADTARRAF